MNISVRIKRSDIFKLSLYFLPRAGANRAFFLIIFLAEFFLIQLKKNPHGLGAHLFSIAVSLAVAGLMIIIGFVFSVPFILLSSGWKSGVLGNHDFRISHEGVKEVTAVNETLQKWVGISSVGRTKSFIFFRIHSNFFHIFPRREFQSEEEFNEFWRLSYGYWSNSQVLSG